MKKIVFLQHKFGLGGVGYVNSALANKFSKDGNKIYVLTVRGRYEDYIKYESNVKFEIINSKEEWGSVLGSEIKSVLFKQKNPIKCFSLLLKRFKYHQKLAKDFNKLGETIKNINPDIIICSHYEVLDAIPKEYLKKTLSHFHNNFNQVLVNKATYKTFDKYKDRIAKFVWLTAATSELAIDNGFSNSTYIYNPIRFNNRKQSNVSIHKTILFLGRVSPQKRVDYLIDLFNAAYKKVKDKSWKLKIYAFCDDKDLLNKISNSPNVEFMGVTKNAEKVLLSSSINALSSLFEGFSMTILEGYNFGVPVISFNFGESVYEQIIDGETGYIIEQNNFEEYVNKLILLMEDKNQLEFMSQKAYEFSKNFNINSVSDKWYELFSEICEHN